MEFISKFMHFNSRKSIWKCLENGGSAIEIHVLLLKSQTNKQKGANDDRFMQSKINGKRKSKKNVVFTTS